MEDFRKYIVPHTHNVDQSDRVKKNGHKPLVLWFTGLSGSGKSTLASALETHLFNQGCSTYILDGDNIRTGLNKDLDFGAEGRSENIRRIGEVSKLFIDAGTVVLTAFISPFKSDRSFVRDLVGTTNFVEIFVECPLEVCEERDVKGLYKKAREGKIKNFTGIDSPFEKPEDADIIVNTNENSLEVCLQKLIDYLEPKIKS